LDRQLIFSKLIKLTLLIVVLVLGWIGGWWENLSGKVNLPKNPPPNPGVPSINLQRTKLIGWDNHKKTWAIEAKRIWQSSEGNIIYFENISKGIIFSIENREAHFKAGWARWEKARAMLYIGGGLEVLVDKHAFKTSEAVMRYTNQEISCERRVSLTGPEVRIHAQKMKLDLDREEVFLEGNVVLVLSQGQDRVATKALIYNLKDESYQLMKPGGITLNL
jgi:LPS export ABC transporter protein LptC